MKLSNKKLNEQVGNFLSRYKIEHPEYRHRLDIRYEIENNIIIFKIWFYQYPKVRIQRAFSYTMFTLTEEKFLFLELDHAIKDLEKEVICR